mgnify:CR=1 FL=1
MLSIRLSDYRAVGLAIGSLNKQPSQYINELFYMESRTRFQHDGDFNIPIHIVRSKKNHLPNHQLHRIELWNYILMRKKEEVKISCTQHASERWKLRRYYRIIKLIRTSWVHRHTAHRKNHKDPAKNMTCLLHRLIIALWRFPTGA